MNLAKDKMGQNLFYRPSKISLFVDFMILIIGIFTVLEWFPLTTSTPYYKYGDTSLFYFVLWFVLSYFFQRYKPLRSLKYVDISFKLVYVTLCAFFISWFISAVFYNNYYSVYVIFTYTTVLFSIISIFYMIYFVVVYAVEYDEENIEISKRANATLKVLNSLDDTSYEERCAAIVEHSGNKLLAELLKSIDLKSENTLVNFSTNYLDISAKQNYKYLTIINLEILNNVRKINKMFATINQKLPDNGYFICCYESKSTRKKRILNTLPPGLNYIFYSVNYLFRRLLPKVFLTRRLYYDLTDGKKRILSKAEVMGRLYCAGFKILKEKKVGQLFYIYAQREKQPNLDVKKIYGPLIKLKRLGKNGIPFEVYKVRTMHPYSEYLQPYIYETYNLQDGGKFNNDIRINTMGRIMRKYFLDELPMLLNLIKGEMKLVGVRPLSTQYFGLYSEELQQKRLKYKPGLLPPFYADMPHTLDEIQDSEMNYLRQCEQNGTGITDIRYFFKILKSILFNQARSS